MATLAGGDIAELAEQCMQDTKLVYTKGGTHDHKKMLLVGMPACSAAVEGEQDDASRPQASSHVAVCCKHYQWGHWWLQGQVHMRGGQANYLTRGDGNANQCRHQQDMAVTVEMVDTGCTMALKFILYWLQMCLPVWRSAARGGC